jgi:O-antigen ligase
MTLRPRALFTTFEGWAWFLGLMLVFWAPLPGEQRLPATLLLPLGLWIAWRRRDRLNDLPGSRPMRIFLACLILPCLASMPFSADLDASMRVLVILVLFYWVGLALRLGLDARPIRWFALGVGATLLLWALDALIQWRLGVDLLGLPLHPQGRVFGPFGDNQRLGFLAGILLPIVTLTLADRRPIAAVLVFGLLTFVIGLVGARAALVFALLAGVALLFHLGAWRHRLLLLATVVGGVLAVVNLSPVHSERLLQRDYTRYLDDPAYTRGEAVFLQADDFLSGRLKIWHTGWNMFRAHPLVGVGAGAFDTAYDDYSTRPDDQFTTRGGYPGGAHHAHQLYVSAAAETGLVGLAALAYLFTTLIRWYRALPPPGRAHAWPYACALLVAFFPINSQHSLYIGWWFGTVFLIVCAMLVAGEQGRRLATTTS